MLNLVTRDFLDAALRRSNINVAASSLLEKALSLLKYDPHQPRDAHGHFASTGAGAAAVANKHGLQPGDGYSHVGEMQVGDLVHWPGKNGAMHNGYVFSVGGKDPFTIAEHGAPQGNSWKPPLNKLTYEGHKDNLGPKNSWSSTTQSNGTTTHYLSAGNGKVLGVVHESPNGTATVFDHNHTAGLATAGDKHPSVDAAKSSLEGAYNVQGKTSLHGVPAGSATASPSLGKWTDSSMSGDAILKDSHGSTIGAVVEASPGKFHAHSGGTSLGIHNSKDEAKAAIEAHLSSGTSSAPTVSSPVAAVTAGTPTWNTGGSSDHLYTADGTHVGMVSSVGHGQYGAYIGGKLVGGTTYASKDAAKAALEAHHAASQPGSAASSAVVHNAGIAAGSGAAGAVGTTPTVSALHSWGYAGGGVDELTSVAGEPLGSVYQHGPGSYQALSADGKGISYHKTLDDAKLAVEAHHSTTAVVPAAVAPVVPVSAHGTWAVSSSSGDHELYSPTGKHLGVVQESIHGKYDAYDTDGNHLGEFATREEGHAALEAHLSAKVTSTAVPAVASGAVAAVAPAGPLTGHTWTQHPDGGWSDLHTSTGEHVGFVVEDGNGKFEVYHAGVDTPVSVHNSYGDAKVALEAHAAGLGVSASSTSPVAAVAHTAASNPTAAAALSWSTHASKANVQQVKDSTGKVLAELKTVDTPSFKGWNYTGIDGKKHWATSEAKAKADIEASLHKAGKVSAPVVVAHGIAPAAPAGPTATHSWGNGYGGSSTQVLKDVNGNVVGQTYYANGKWHYTDAKYKAHTSVSKDKAMLAVQNVVQQKHGVPVVVGASTASTSAPSASHTPNTLMATHVTKTPITANNYATASKPFADEITVAHPSEAHALHSYSGSNYGMNTSLDGNGGNISALSSQTQSHIAKLDKATQRVSLGHETLLERGVSVSITPAVLSKYKPGALVDEARFNSTGIGFHFGGDLQFRFTAPVGTHGALMDGLSSSAHENEFLLPRHTPFIIDKVEHVGNKLTVYATIQPNSDVDIAAHKTKKKSGSI